MCVYICLTYILDSNPFENNFRIIWSKKQRNQKIIYFNYSNLRTQVSLEVSAAEELKIQDADVNT